MLNKIKRKIFYKLFKNYISILSCREHITDYELSSCQINLEGVVKEKMCSSLARELINYVHWERLHVDDDPFVTEFKAKIYIWNK